MKFYFEKFGTKPPQNSWPISKIKFKIIGLKEIILKQIGA
jgi:hypothetical protein